jgi:hypothetical protein
MLDGRDMGLVVLSKLGLGFFQVVLLQPSVFDIRLPDKYLRFLARFSFLSFGLPFHSFECFTSTNNDDHMYVVAVLSTIIMGVLVVGVARSSNHQNSLLALVIVPSYLVYPTFSAAFFQTLQLPRICRSIAATARTCERRQWLWP